MSVINHNFRVAIGSIFTECNHFGGMQTDLARFAMCELRRGADILQQTSGSVGGILHVLGEQRASPVPLLVASACPGGPLTADCYRVLKDELLARLTAELPVEGVLLVLHGSATVEDVGDLEGDLLQAVRDRVGPRVPLVATLDLHAHVTAQMVCCADALVAYETYPHRDAYTTGVRAAQLLLDIVAHKCQPAMALAKVPVLVGAVCGHTEGAGPFADVLSFAKAHEGKEGVLSTSVLLVQPYLDLPDMGGGGLVITDGDMDLSVSRATEIAHRYWARRFDLDPPVFQPEAAIRRGLQISDGPVLLVETADCCGGGAAGDSIATLKALLDFARQSSLLGSAFVPIVDPAAAALCHRVGVGQEVSLRLGHQLDPRWGNPVQLTALISRLSDGRFHYTGGIWEGQEANMGPTALLTLGPIKILVASYATYDWADEQFRCVGLDASTAKFVVVKNPMNYRLGYSGIFKEALILDTPGPTPAVLTHVQYKNLRRPYYPADREIPSLTPVVYRNDASGRR